MRAQVLFTPKIITEKPLKRVDLPTPIPDPGQIRLRVTACGVCHTDLHTVEGDLALPKLPVTPGHQVVGVVDAVGAAVTDFHPGQRVGSVWLYRTCGECRYCLSGRENLCERAQFTGFHADGGYAEYMVVDAAFAYHLPEGLSDAEITPLLCGGVIGYRALRLSEAKRGDVLGLYGFGNSAHITIQVARYWGCRVFVFTRSPGHQDHARALGAEWVGRAEEAPPAGVDSIIVFAPAGELVPEALRVLNPGGTIALAGIHMSNIPEMPYALLYGERTLRSVANSTRRDVIELLELAREIPIHTDVVTFPLDQANEVLLAMKESRFNGDAVLVP
ncbi:MAG TPA: zinc-dependent alcohol dehydrogenase family protein [Caldilineae bacterium]|nr:zinc-dependent alcohol dehydrogenase family protein [Caldilineae bacterium]